VMGYISLPPTLCRYYMCDLFFFLFVFLRFWRGFFLLASPTPKNQINISKKITPKSTPPPHPFLFLLCRVYCALCFVSICAVFYFFRGGWPGGLTPLGGGRFSLLFSFLGGGGGLGGPAGGVRGLQYLSSGGACGAYLVLCWGAPCSPPWSLHTVMFHDALCLFRFLGSVTKTSTQTSGSIHLVPPVALCSWLTTGFLGGGWWEWGLGCCWIVVLVTACKLQGGGWARGRS